MGAYILPANPAIAGAGGEGRDAHLPVRLRDASGQDRRQSRQYGFASASGCLVALGTPGCLASSTAVQNSYFYWDAIHPTSAGFALIARYMANQIDAPLTVAPQADVALATV